MVNSRKHTCLSAALLLVIVQRNFVQSSCSSELVNDGDCRPNNTTSMACMGRGRCECGVCECDKRNNPEELIFGKFCECDNFSCERYNGLLCSGISQGVCECGVCTCNPGWTGSDCSCRLSTDSCMPENGVEICSGHGECVCGACRCEVTADGRYSGKFCHKCPTCAGRCHELKDCVQCQIYRTGAMGSDAELCAKNCTQVVPIVVEVLQVNEKDEDHLCVFYDEDDCRFQFVYNDRDHSKFTATERECRTQSFQYIRNFFNTIRKKIG